MKAFVFAALVAGVLAAAAISFAQHATVPLTRAEAENSPRLIEYPSML
jgi:hypothetical protein